MNHHAWTIAGIDPTGQAGIATDLIVFKYFGLHGCAVTTAVTAQNNQALKKIYCLPKEMIAAQLQSLNRERSPQAIKIGMLGNVDTIHEILHFLKIHKKYVVLDSLLKSSSGKNLFEGSQKSYIEHLKLLAPYVDLVTPNIPETEALTQHSLQSFHDIENAAQELLMLGFKNILIKGGHFSKDFFSQDYWTNGRESFWLATPRSEPLNYRGTGCTFSSAITACLALNYDIKDAIVIAKMYVNRAIRLAHRLPQQSALLHHGDWPEDEIDMPFLSHTPLTELPRQSPRSGPIGLYPIVDSSHWIKILFENGVKTAQLRIKNKWGTALEKEIDMSIQLANRYQAKLYINDYWELAIRYQAHGVHLGQEDLLTAHVQHIKQSDLYLGISTHCYYEVARAHALRPSYIACGPIYPTHSKIMPFSPQGVLRLKRWRRTLSYPLVAIGGIHSNNINSVLATHVDGIAMISAITQASDPAQTIHQFLRKVSSYDTEFRRIETI